jgi:branched-chain amino acid transport system substrate-binding protein
MNRRNAIRQLGAVGAAVAFPALAQPKIIVIGQSAALSGPARALGEEFRRGAMLYFDRVNAAGGVAGQRIDLRTLDDGYEPDRCAANTTKLIDSGAFALFGYIGTPTSLAALPLITRARTPFIAPFTGAEALRAPLNRNVFHVRASYFDETAEIVRQISAVGIERIGVLYQNDGYGKAGLEGVTRALKPLNREPVGLGSVERNTVDVGAAVSKILGSKPDAIVLVSAYLSCAAFIRAARAAGFAGNFYNLSFVGTKALADELGKQAQGVVVSQVMPYPYTPLTPLSGEYLAAGAAAASDAFAPNYSSMEGYVAGKTLVEGLKRAGPNPTQQSLITGLESLRDFNMGGFFVDFSPSKHVASKLVDLTLLTPDGKVRR